MKKLEKVILSDLDVDDFLLIETESGVEYKATVTVVFQVKCFHITAMSEDEEEKELGHFVGWIIETGKPIRFTSVPKQAHAHLERVFWEDTVKGIWLADK